MQKRDASQWRHVREEFCQFFPLIPPLCNFLEDPLDERMSMKMTPAKREDIPKRGKIATECGERIKQFFEWVVKNEDVEAAQIKFADKTEWEIAYDNFRAIIRRDDLPLKVTRRHSEEGHLIFLQWLPKKKEDEE